MVDAGTGTPQTAFTFDSQGNRLTRTAYDEYGQIVSTESGAYNDLDQCSAWGDNTYTYDGNGSLTSKTDSAGTTYYEYDTVGNLLSVDPPSANDEIEYEIDALGNRIARLVNGVVTNRWVYGGGISPLAETDPATGSVLRRYVYGTHTNVPDYMVDYSGASPEVYAFMHDHRGSVRRVVNVATGVVAQAIDYDESGRVTSDTNPGFQPFGFAGGLYDPATGLTRFGLRDYDPIPGRWTSLDPIGFAGGINQYGYVIRDPVNYFDPSGLGPDEPYSMWSDPNFWNAWADSYQDWLGWAGMVPFLGEPADGVNTAISAVRGNWGDVAINAACMIPVGGTGVRAADKANDVRKVMDRYGDDASALIDLAKQAKRTGVDGEDAKTLLNWADEYGVRGDNHIGTDHWIGGDHIRIGQQNHIPVR